MTTTQATPRPAGPGAATASRAATPRARAARGTAPAGGAARQLARTRWFARPTRGVTVRDVQRGGVYDAEQLVRTVFDRVDENGLRVVESHGSQLTLPVERKFASLESGADLCREGVGAQLGARSLAPSCGSRAPSGATSARYEHLAQRWRCHSAHKRICVGVARTRPPTRTRAPPRTRSGRHRAARTRILRALHRPRGRNRRCRGGVSAASDDARLRRRQIG